MSNMNNIENEKMLAFADDYAELCRKHGLYLVLNGDVWLQYAGDAQDLAEVAPSLIAALNENYGGGVALTDAQLPKKRCENA
jgi:hypothetical protein